MDGAVVKPVLCCITSSFGAGSLSAGSTGDTKLGGQ